MPKLTLDVARPLGLGNVVKAILDTPVVGPYPKFGVSRGDGTVWVRDSIVQPRVFEEKVPQGKRVILSTLP